MIGRPRNRRAIVARRRGRQANGVGAGPRSVAQEPPSLPSSPRARRMRRLVALGLAASVTLWPISLGARKVAHHPALGIRHIKVQGAEHATEEEILALAGVEVGSPWLLLDARTVGLRLESHPWVARGRVLRPWPGEVRLSVRECAPVARIEIGGRVYGLCPDLRIVPAAAGSLPIVRSGGRGAKNPDALDRALDYLEELRSGGLPADEPIELDVEPPGEGTDRLCLPSRGFVATVAVTVPVPQAVRNILVFLETLDEQGGSRGTLRLVSSDTGVWRPLNGRRTGAG